MSECSHGPIVDRFDPELAQRVKVGDRVYLPRPNLSGDALPPNEVLTGIVESAQDRQLSIRHPNGWICRAMRAHGYGGWRATWDEAFKVGQMLFVAKIADVEAIIQIHEKQLRKWERMQRNDR